MNWWLIRISIVFQRHYLCKWLRASFFFSSYEVSLRSDLFSIFIFFPRIFFSVQKRRKQSDNLCWWLFFLFFFFSLFHTCSRHTVPKRNIVCHFRKLMLVFIILLFLLCLKKKISSSFSIIYIRSAFVELKTKSRSSLLSPVHFLQQLPASDETPSNSCMTT